MIVLDASALLAWLVDQTALGFDLFANPDAHAPHLIDVEIVSALRRLVAANQLTVKRASEALDDCADFPLNRYPHTLLAARMWELRDNLSAYDAAYVALAELLDAPLLTRDRRLANAPGHGATIELV